MKTQLKNIVDLHLNEDNPRYITEDKLRKLVQSVEDFPQMLEMRPVVVDENFVVLGGNMRLRACIQLGMEKVPVIIAKGLTNEQKQEFIIKDNVGFGLWDWDILGNTYEPTQLEAWGLEVFQASDVDLNDFFEDNNTEPKEPAGKIVLEYENEAESAAVKDALLKHGATPEQAVKTLLKL